MTEEEYFRKYYPDSCYGERPLSPYWDFFQDGVEFGERQSEKKIAELEKQIEELKKDFVKSCQVREQLTKEGQHALEELEAQIDKMKCCENCKYKDCDKTSQYQTCWYCKNKDKWKLKEVVE